MTTTVAKSHFDEGVDVGKELGAAEERAAIIAWMKAGDPAWSTRYMVSAILRGEHLPERLR